MYSKLLVDDITLYLSSALSTKDIRISKLKASLPSSIMIHSHSSLKEKKVVDGKTFQEVHFLHLLTSSYLAANRNRWPSSSIFLFVPKNQVLSTWKYNISQKKESQDGICQKPVPIIAFRNMDVKQFYCKSHFSISECVLPRVNMRRGSSNHCVRNRHKQVLSEEVLKQSILTWQLRGF
jgi:hypothetical protein